MRPRVSALQAKSLASRLPPLVVGSEVLAPVAQSRPCLLRSSWEECNPFCTEFISSQQWENSCSYATRGTACCTLCAIHVRQLAVVFVSRRTATRVPRKSLLFLANEIDTFFAHLENILCCFYNLKTMSWPRLQYNKVGEPGRRSLTYPHIWTSYSEKFSVWWNTLF